VELSPRKGVTPEVDPDTWLEWGEVTEDLLRWLV
jgi:hypothetical protein